jgi:hypothetical protein
MYSPSRWMHSAVDCGRLFPLSSSRRTFLLDGEPFAGHSHLQEIVDMSSGVLVAAVAGSLALATTIGVAAPITRATPPQGVQQSSVPQGDPVAGISCDAMEGMKIHIHQHLVLLDHGKPLLIPNNVGRPMMRQCLYWVHTHTPDGIIHIESPAMRTFTLGEFFTIWGQPLTRTQASSMKSDKGAPLKVWVNGKPYTGDPRKIQLTAHADVVIEAGPPYPKPPKFTNWGTL